MTIQTIKYDNGTITLLDQTQLPTCETYLKLTTVQQVHRAICDMNVRGAPAIGVCAAYGMCIAARESSDICKLSEAGEYLCTARPTATNLSWAVARMLDAAKGADDVVNCMECEAQRIFEEDAQINRHIGENLLTLLPHSGTIMTYCNAGALATTRYGTALAPVYVGMETGRHFSVYVCETRPRLQGSRLTAFELNAAGVNVTLICDNNAANVLKSGKVDAVITGCDCVAANGDVANKIGTMGLSVLAKEFGVPFYIAAPTPTIDLMAKTGNDIVIEYRDESEVSQRFGVRTAPEGVRILNPAFDVTPADNITAIVTEHGIFPPKKIGDFAAS